MAAVWARPLALVTAVGLPRVAEALPGAGAAKVTVAPRIGFDDASVTRTTMGANPAPTVTVWGLPLTSVSNEAAPARLLSAKVAGVATPGAVALTL